MLFYVTLDDVSQMDDAMFEEVWNAYALIAKARARAWKAKAEAPK